MMKKNLGKILEGLLFLLLLIMIAVRTFYGDQMDSLCLDYWRNDRQIKM